MCYSTAMAKRIGLRAKVYLMIVPLVIVVVAVSGTLASLASRTALTGVATRLMAYKAEQLRDYVWSEWEVVTELELDDVPVYRELVEQSTRSFATSLLRSETELIVALGPAGDIVMSAGLTGSLAAAGVTESATEVTVPDPGWFDAEILAAQRVGVAFDFEPFDWTLLVMERRDVFFSDAEDIMITHAAILVGSMLFVMVLIGVFGGIILRPVERLTDAVRHISESTDLSRRVAVESTDEVGALAHEFNVMIGSLEKNYLELRQKTRTEAEARHLATEREEETLLLLGRASEYRDEDTGEHLKRVGELCVALARLCGLSIEQQELIRRSSPLHDIGKIGIPDRILLKPGKLSADEYEVMKRHTIIGHELLKDARSIYLIDGAQVALTHHEKWDGTGYPSQLSGEEIPLSGRIVGLVDVFDALTSHRSYKEIWSAEDARDYIIAERGRHFDPRLVDLFEQHFPWLRPIILR